MTDEKDKKDEKNSDSEEHGFVLSLVKFLFSVCILIGAWSFLHQKPLFHSIIAEIKTYPFIRDTDWATGKTHLLDNYKPATESQVPTRSVTAVETRSASAACAKSLGDRYAAPSQADWDRGYKACLASARNWLNNPDKPKDNPLTEPEAPTTVGDIRTAGDIRREHREYEAYLRSPLLFKSQNPDLYETFRIRDRREIERSLSIIKPDAVEKSSDLDKLLDWNQATSRKIQEESSKQ